MQIITLLPVSKFYENLHTYIRKEDVCGVFFLNIIGWQNLEHGEC